MKTMKEIIKPSVLRFIKSVRLQRGGGWRAARAGVVVVVVVVWVWVYFVSPNAHTPPSLTHGDWSSGSPNLQVAAPIKGGLGDSGREQVEAWRRNNIRIENKINPIKVEDEEERKGRIERRREGGILIEEEDKSIKHTNKKKEVEEEEQEQETNPRYNRIRENNLGLGKKIKDEQIFPNIFPKRRLILPGDTKLLEEEDEDEEEEEVQEEEEEGKWKGRNKEERDNHAMEEDDDAGIDKNNDDFVEEDVGGEIKKKKRQRREKPRSRKVENKSNDKNIQDNPKKTEENGYKPNKENRKELLKENAKHDLDLLAIEEEMRQRRSKVKQVCARYGLGPHAPPGAQRKVKHPPTPAYESFYIDRKDKLAWCPVYKAASTSWLYAFLGLAGISETYVKNTKEQVSTVARRVWPALSYDEAQQAASTCVKAIVVRHPFERLVSAFRDKLEQVAGGEIHGTEHFYQKYGKRIVEKYRYKSEGGGKIMESHRNQEGMQGKLSDRYREGVEARLRGKNTEHKISNDGMGWKDGEMVRDSDKDGREGYNERVGVKGDREKEIRGKNDSFRDKEGDLGPQKPPLRYSNAIDADPHQPPPPPPPPPPQRYRHLLAISPPQLQPDEPQQPPPQRYRHLLAISPPQLQPDEPQQPPPQRYKHILVDDPPAAIQEVESLPVRKEPTFSEFVRYLIDTDLTLYADDHWLPYYLSCTPCLVDFDVIAKFETLKRDQDFLLRKTNLGKKLNFSWQHLTKGNQTKEVVRGYFAHVSKNELLSLFSKYKLDFEMFGYTVDEYLGYVKAD